MMIAAANTPSDACGRKSQTHRGKVPTAIKAAKDDIRQMTAETSHTASMLPPTAGLPWIDAGQRSSRQDADRDRAQDIADDYGEYHDGSHQELPELPTPRGSTCMMN